MAAVLVPTALTAACMLPVALLATLRQHLTWLREDLKEHVVSTLQWDT